MIDFITLSVAQIIGIHQYSVQLFGGSIGHFPDTSQKIDGILSQLYPVFGCDKYPTVFQKAAALLYFLAKDHCFQDGNKRVAIASAFVFLYVNGYEENIEEDEGILKNP